ncbi:MAG: hypothetical protein KA385_13510 [Vicinamibacteria bacterium]|nr:hypothetical protein [Vicinamibacteria bacterium]
MHEADILTPDEQKALALQGAREAAVVARERYGIDLAKVARDPAERLALAAAFAADRMLDPSTPANIQGAFCKLLMESATTKIEGPATKGVAAPGEAPEYRAEPSGRSIFRKAN